MVKNVLKKTKDKTCKTLDDIKIELKKIIKPTKRFTQKLKSFNKLDTKEIYSNTSTHSSSKELQLSPVTDQIAIDENSDGKLCYITQHIDD